ncbi:MAG: hypothetical protein NE328_05730 [Lentisphaeraceae bacterium]|nr:hypothetical protein [Lentisphaeraceae bacterium]
MALQTDEQDELVELVEEQSNVIREMAITQNALLSLLIERGHFGNDELEAARNEISKALEESD